MRIAWRPSSVSLARELRTAAAASLTYAEVGGTGAPELPAGYQPLTQAAVVGSGKTAWQRLADALSTWALHREAGMLIVADSEDVRHDSTVVNAAPVGPVALLAPCRVVRVIAAPTRSGFAYGTLPGHPLTGEEEFMVELDDAGRVRLQIRSFSRPVGLARVSPAVARAGQRMVNRRYLAAARRLAV
jgi:uncharacterized protein (UPF0548 family)